VKSVDLNAINSPQQTKAPRAKAVRPKASDAVKQPTARTSDQVSVSGAAVEVGRLVDRAKGLSDVRQERVDSLKELIDSGQYEVNANDIAAAIIRDEK